jgi:hypothetical protein
VPVILVQMQRQRAHADVTSEPAVWNCWVLHTLCCWGTTFRSRDGHLNLLRRVKFLIDKLLYLGEGLRSPLLNSLSCLS